MTGSHAVDDYVEDYQLSDNEDFIDQPAVSDDGARSSEDEGGEERAPLSRGQRSKWHGTAGAAKRDKGGPGRGSSRALAVHRGGKDGDQGRKRMRGRSRRVS